MSIGSRITEARKRRDMTQEALAERIGVTKGAIANYENGISVPKTAIMYRLFDALDIDANFLYQDDMVTPPRSASLAIDESRLLSVYRTLSPDGRIKAQAYLDDLAKIYYSEKNYGVPISGAVK